MEEKTKIFTRKIKEKIKKNFKKMLLTGTLIINLLTPNYSLVVRARGPPNFPEYKKEVKAINEDDYMGSFKKDPTFRGYRMAHESIKKKQEKVGEGVDIKLDYMMLHTIYALARGPPEPDTAVRYLEKAIDLGMKYYERWRDVAFLDIVALSYRNIGDIYFRTAEDVKKGELYLILLKEPTKSLYYPYYGDMTQQIVLDGSKFRYEMLNDLGYYYGNCKIDEIIHRKIYLPFYEKAKEYYEKFLDFYEKEIKEKIKDNEKDYPIIVEETNQILQIINEILKRNTKSISEE